MSQAQFKLWLIHPVRLCRSHTVTSVFPLSLDVYQGLNWLIMCCQINFQAILELGLRRNLATPIIQILLAVMFLKTHMSWLNQHELHVTWWALKHETVRNKTTICGSYNLNITTPFLMIFLKYPSLWFCLP